MHGRNWSSSNEDVRSRRGYQLVFFPMWPRQSCPAVAPDPRGFLSGDRSGGSGLTTDSREVAPHKVERTLAGLRGAWEQEEPVVAAARALDGLVPAAPRGIYLLDSSQRVLVFAANERSLRGLTEATLSGGHQRYLVRGSDPMTNRAVTDAELWRGNSDAYERYENMSPRFGLNLRHTLRVAFQQPAFLCCEEGDRSADRKFS